MTRPRPHEHPACVTDAVLRAACKLTRTRASGPGGQHRNRVQTAVVLEHVPTGVKVTASERRRAVENEAVARSRLRLALAVQVRCDAADKPTPMWTSRSRGGRISVSPRHDDLARMIAEALDALAADDWDGSVTAGRLSTTQSQLVRLLALHAPALEVWNAERVARGLRRLSAR